MTADDNILREMKNKNGGLLEIRKKRVKKDQQGYDKLQRQKRKNATYRTKSNDYFENNPAYLRLYRNNQWQYTNWV